MFDAYEFIFDGQSSMMHGLMIYDIGGDTQERTAFGNLAEIVETRTNNRIQPIHFGVNYNAKPLEFKLIFGAEEPFDRYTMQEIGVWLTGHQDYKWLSICQPDLEYMQFRCIIESLTPIVHGWLPVAFEAKVKCDSPYAYGPLFQHEYQVSGETNILIQNLGSVNEYLKPTLRFQNENGITELSIKNYNDNNYEFLLQNMSASIQDIVVDNNNGIIYEPTGGHNLYDGFNMNFFRLVRGDNNLTVRGEGTLTISGRFLYNVAG